MDGISRRAFIEAGTAIAARGASSPLGALQDDEHASDRELNEGWRLQCCALVSQGGEVISQPGFATEGWHKTSVPRTVLSALVRDGIYPDPRIGLNTYRIPDSSDEFNRKYDLAKFSHLPDKRNPWREPYWYRTEFTIPAAMRGKRVWLLFKGINYRADVWLNGRQLANRDTMAGMYQRFFLDGGMSQPGLNCLAVKVYPVDHPASPSPQLTVFGRPRNYVTDLMKDVTYTVSVGYDCMLPQPDRDMGLWQGVLLRLRGPVDIRNPFVVTDLPLPATKPARLTVSAELVNATDSRQSGVLRGTILAAGAIFETPVTLRPGETREISFSPNEFPQLVLADPRLWWPAGFGDQPLYDLALEFKTGGATSAVATAKFGIRKVTREVYLHNGWPGLRIYINGQKNFSRGGWIHPDLLLDWDEKRIDAEVRYFAQANLNTVCFEDIPMPADEFLDACDRHGVLFWNAFYGSAWVSAACSWANSRFNPFTMPYSNVVPGDRDYPLDHDLLERCTADVIKRYRNHPSLIMYCCMGEGMAARDVYERWRKQVLALDRTRPFVNALDQKCRFPWLDQDWPSGLDDAAHTPIHELKDYYQCVQNGGEWMFSTEIPFLASMPPVDSLRRFIPDLWTTRRGPAFPLNATWAHLGANSYFQPYDTFIRRVYGEPDNVEDYCMKGHLVTAEHHRAVSEAVNHRMWDITSGSWEWKINSSFPDVQWQIHDWYLRPMVSLYYYRLAFEPLHVQYNYLDRMITVVNQTRLPRQNLEAHAQVYSFSGKLLWEKRATVNAAANTYGDVFSVPDVPNVTPVYFLRLTLRDSAGNAVSRNFYWLSAAAEADFRNLAKLPAVQLQVAHTIEKKGSDTLTRVTLQNPANQIAFFVHVAVLDAKTGNEVLPVRWDDNYFSLVPGESREVRAMHAGEDLKGAAPVVDVCGWNVLSPFEASAMRLSRSEVRLGELFEVSARIRNTGLDGSIVQVVADGQPLAWKRVWARDGQSRDVQFQVWLDTPGTHSLQIGGERAAVHVWA